MNGGEAKGEGFIGKFFRRGPEKKAVKLKAIEAGNSLLRGIEGRITANTEVLPQVSKEALTETLQAFWNTDEGINPDSEVTYDLVEKVRKQLETRNPHLAKIINEWDSVNGDGTEGAYLLTMILSAITHNSNPR